MAVEERERHTSSDNKNNLPIDRGWAWMIVASSWLTFFIIGGTLRTLGILLKEMVEVYEAPNSVIFLFLSVEGVVYAFAAPIGVLLGDQFTARTMVLIGSGIGCLGMALGFFAFNFPYLICTYGIGFGIGNGLILGNSIIMVTRYFEKRRSLANGLAMCGAGFGQLALPPLLQFFLDKYLLEGSLLLSAGIYLHLVICGSLLRPLSFYARGVNHTYGSKDDIHGDTLKPGVVVEDDGPIVVIETKFDMNNSIELSRNNDSKKRIQNYPDQEQSVLLLEDSNVTIASNIKLHSIEDLHGLSKYTNVENVLSVSLASLAHFDDEHAIKKLSLKEKLIPILRTMFDFSIMKNYDCLHYILCLTFAFAGIFNVIFFIPSHSNFVDEDPYKIAILISINGVCDMVGRLLSGFFADFNIIRPINLQATIFVVGGINTIILAFANTYWWLALHSAVYGLCFGGMLPLSVIISVEMVGLGLVTKIFSVLLLVQGGMAAVYQPFLGWVSDYTGSTTAVFIICGSSMCIPGLLIYLHPLAKRAQIKKEKRLANIQAANYQDETNNIKLT